MRRKRCSSGRWGAHQEELGVGGAAMIVNLALSKGYLGREGCGLMPMPLHVGLPGAAAMGAMAGALPGHLPMTRETRAAMSARWGFEVPSAPGFNAPDMLEAAGQDQLSLLYCLGGDFQAPGFDERHVRRCLSACRCVCIRI